jgi:hypothetical protein
MSRFIYCDAERHYAECHYAECRYAECRVAKFSKGEEAKETAVKSNFISSPIVSTFRIKISSSSTQKIDTTKTFKIGYFFSLFSSLSVCHFPD